MPVSMLDAVLSTLVASLGRVNIIQVGANDGRLSDPIFRFISKNVEQTSVVLVEPQPDVAEVLRDNYLFHPRKEVVCAAVGVCSSSVAMYRIRRDYWTHYVNSGKRPGGSPLKATGITSMSRDHVLSHLKKKLGRNLKDLDSVIEEIHVPCKSLDEIIDETSLFSRLDFLQVDAEGFDDTIVANALASKYKPVVINFEYRHIAENKMQSLLKVLDDNGYHYFRWSRSDMLAFRWR